MSWKQQIRQFQDEQQNVGWRIRMIPYDDSSKPMAIEMNWIANVGAIGFIVGILLMIHSHNPQDTPFFNFVGNGGDVARFGLWMTVGGLLLTFFGIWIKARSKRKIWEIESARCVDRELKKVRLTKGGEGWYWRIVCEHEFHGEKYRVTPIVQWSNFMSEQAAIKFIEGKISSDGECKLHINPKNPLQTELVGQRIADKLLY